MNHIGNADKMVKQAWEFNKANMAAVAEANKNLWDRIRERALNPEKCKGNCHWNKLVADIEHKNPRFSYPKLLKGVVQQAKHGPSKVRKCPCLLGPSNSAKSLLITKPLIALCGGVDFVQLTPGTMGNPNSFTALADFKTRAAIFDEWRCEEQAATANAGRGGISLTMFLQLCSGEPLLVSQSQTMTNGAARTNFTKPVVWAGPVEHFLPDDATVVVGEYKCHVINRLDIEVLDNSYPPGTALEPPPGKDVCLDCFCTRSFKADLSQPVPEPTLNPADDFDNILIAKRAEWDADATKQTSFWYDIVQERITRARAESKFKSSAKRVNPASAPLGIQQPFFGVPASGASSPNAGSSPTASQAPSIAASIYGQLHHPLIGLGVSGTAGALASGPGSAPAQQSAASLHQGHNINDASSSVASFPPPGQIPPDLMSYVYQNALKMMQSGNWMPSGGSPPSS
ncbi:unnamed protein product [Amoebophrya sp. A25]|nr:unnamed protein product [Amoebophrya sp. A25]|eukprot:GSA25T00027074001.1